jgi:hypothetical protein
MQFTLIIGGIAAIFVPIFMLKWRIYKPMFGKRQDANPWQQYWGELYGLELKQRLLKPVFDNLREKKRLAI